MTLWNISPSYKFELACVCNLFSNQDRYIKAHPEGWEKFKHLFSNPQYQKLAAMLNEQGFIISSALIAIFDSFDYNGGDIDEICMVTEDQELRATVLRSYFLDNNIISPEQWEQYSPLMPQLTDMARYVHEGGFAQYWQDNCLPEIRIRCQEFMAQAGQYPVIEEVNTLLGPKYALTNEAITLYLCKFSAPHGTSLAVQGFVSDIRWDLETTVAIALHEMMHPPFDRKRIEKIAAELAQDEFVAEARKLLPPSYYPTPRMFVEENIVEGAHIYLAEKLGVEDNPLEYFVKHDSGSHVLSVILYDALKQGIAAAGLSLEEVIDKMSASTMCPGKIRSAYMAVYEKTGQRDIVPF